MLSEGKKKKCYSSLFFVVVNWQSSLYCWIANKQLNFRVTCYISPQQRINSLAENKILADLAKYLRMVLETINELINFSE
jgi:hypothetical protein